jgi:hypothetical protein
MGTPIFPEISSGVFCWNSIITKKSWPHRSEAYLKAFRKRRLQWRTNAENFSINAIAEIKDKNSTAFIVAGNLFDSEVETPRNDASIGLVLKSDVKGEIRVIPPSESGLAVKGEVKAIGKIKLASGKDGFLFAINNDSLKLIELGFNP